MDIFREIGFEKTFCNLFPAEGFFKKHIVGVMELFV
jgi:hypothetical protein